jgi:hypothetical protein
MLILDGLSGLNTARIATIKEREAERPIISLGQNNERTPTHQLCH